MTADDALTQAELLFLAAARSAILGTISRDGQPRIVPICFRSTLPSRRCASGRRWTTNPRRRRSARSEPSSRHRGKPSRVAPGPRVVGGLVCARVAPPGWPGGAHRAWRGGNFGGAWGGRGSPPGQVPAIRHHRLERRPIIRILIRRRRSWGISAPSPTRDRRDGVSRVAEHTPATRPILARPRTRGFRRGSWCTELAPSPLLHWSSRCPRVVRHRSPRRSDPARRLHRRRPLPQHRPPRSRARLRAHRRPYSPRFRRGAAGV